MIEEFDRLTNRESPKVKALFWLLYLPLLVVVAAFAAANRHDMEINLDPLLFGLTAPVFAIVLSSILLGLIVGGLSAWFSGRQSRRNARKLRRHNALLETEIAALREKVDAQQLPVPGVQDSVLPAPTTQQPRSLATSSHELAS
ncbi:MAG: hypothetical protein CL569_09820 [Alphaproteobacteria bacterium]|nr:hypothetical protein [Alphaproteobacteria bacterium]|tara:strand:- start:396 stop:827 length:432 start_codon:yes stop_codon:yes gene_type:complete